MGYELWTSPITGYRRKGTRLAELRALIDSGITAHAILEPLQSCALASEAFHVAQILEKRDFDLCGVKTDPQGPVVGWVERSTLTTGIVADHLLPINANQLASDGTPLPSLMGALRTRSHMFILIGTDVAGIVTRADLNKPPVRVYMFTLISLLEMHLGFWVRVEYPDDTWINRLRPNRLEAAIAVRDERRAKNQDPFLIDCLQFCDKRDLVLLSKRLRTQLKLGGKSKADSLLKCVEKLRNNLAHSQHDLVDGTTWEDIIGVIEQTEEIVRNSDQQVELMALGHSLRDDDGLWASA